MAEKVRDYSKLAKEIVQYVGGDKNIVSAGRCATRLRLVLGETPPDAKEKISALPGVITVVESGGQFQVVIGTHVADVFEQVSSDLDLENNPRTADGVGDQASLLNKVIGVMSASIAPFVYVLAAAGILQGNLIITRMIWPAFENSGTDEVFSFISWTPFTFMPILIALGAAKYFRANTYIAVTCCAALVNPTWGEIAGRIAEGETVSLFGIIPLNQTTYTSTVLPPIFLVWLLSYLEHWLDDHLNDTIKPLFTPFFCLIIMVPFTLLVIGPVTTWAAEAWLRRTTGCSHWRRSLPRQSSARSGRCW